MKCQEVRQLWDLYYDSEGDAELHFQCNQHLENCPACAEWFEKQSRLESRIQQQLAATADAGTHLDVNWSKVMIGAGVTPVAKSRSWLFLGSTMLTLVASVLMMLGWFSGHFDDEGSPSLSHLTAVFHQQVSAGDRHPEFQSDSDIEVDQYLLRRVSFPVRCPPRKDSGFVVGGAGMCELADQPAAYVVGSVDQKPVSVFVLPQESLLAFPRQHDELLRSPLATDHQANSEMVFSVVDKNIVLVIGQVEREKLTRVLKSYGTYPHAS